MGYAQSKVQDFKNIKGVNAQYRYEWDSPISVIGSLSYMSGSVESTDYVPFLDSSLKTKENMKYWSVLVGPAYRFNDYVSAYVAGGLAHTKVKADIYLDDYHMDGSKRNNNFAYGAGIIVNPTENIVINAGYEGSRAHIAGEKFNINGFNIGVGYRF